MATRSELEHLDSGAARRLEQLAGRLEQSWRDGREVDLRDLLPPPSHPLRTAYLHALIEAELAVRWQLGKGAPLEWYLERYPELGPAPALPTGLILAECMARQRHGDCPTLDDYQLRFPDQFEALRGYAEGRPTGDLFPATLPPPPGLGKVAAALVIHGYRLVESLGRGSLGEVWRAEARGGIPVAVKIVPRREKEELEGGELASLTLTGTLRHPHLLQTHAYWIDDDHIHIVTELAEGTLREHDQAQRERGLPGLPPEALFRYFREVADALDYLHRKDVVHRDVKPDTILIQAGHAKLGALDLAAPRQPDGATADRDVVGTPPYMAPEAWEGKPGPASDQYSLAASYAEVRGGQRVFSGDTPAELYFAHRGRGPDLESLSAAERPVLLRALDKDPGRRYGSCLEFVRSLEEAGSGPGSELLPPGPVRSEQRSNPDLSPADPTSEWPTVRYDLMPPTGWPAETPRPASAGAETSEKELIETATDFDMTQEGSGPPVREEPPAASRSFVSAVASGLASLAGRFAGGRRGRTVR